MTMELETRRQALRLPLKELARAAVIHEGTVKKALSGGADTRRSTLTRIELALADLERAALRHLVGLYPGLALELLSGTKPPAPAAEARPS